MAEKILNQKVQTLEKDILEIKRYLGFLDVFQRDRDFENWQKIKKISREVRKKLFKEKYPKLYERFFKERERK